MGGRTGSEGTVARTLACRLSARHGLVMSVDLRLGEPVVVNGDFADRACEPGIVRHGTYIERAVIRSRCDVVLAHAAGLSVIGLIPLHAIDPDVDRTRRRR